VLAPGLGEFAAGSSDGMVKRWAAAAFLATEKNFRKLMGHEQFWALAAILGRKSVTSTEKLA